jgi:hypothetical protein
MNKYKFFVAGGIYLILSMFFPAYSTFVSPITSTFNQGEDISVKDV